MLTIHLNGDFDSVPYGAEWLGHWAMLEANVDHLRHLVESIDLNLHLSQVQQAKAGTPSKLELTTTNDGSIAMITLAGTLQKQRASLSKSTSTVEARQLLRQAAADPAIKAIMLYIDSPGGTVAGTNELATEVAKAAAKKPVYAAIEDLGASAAYWVASQASKVFVNATGRVGSIGTYTVVQDLRRVADARGITVHVVRAGEFKGTGTPGTEITAPQLAELQREVQQLNQYFLDAVARGRKMTAEQVSALNDGRVHVGLAAQQLNLVDGVATAEEVIAQLQQLISAGTSKGTPRMSQENQPTGPRAATLAELKAEFPEASNDFIVAQLGANATMETALKAYAKQEREARLKAESAAADALAKANKPGIAPLSSNPSDGKTEDLSSPISAFNDAVAEQMKLGKSKPQAIAAVAKEQPELRKAYVAAHNARFGRKQSA